jgi:hypothetical protein
VALKVLAKPARRGAAVAPPSAEPAAAKAEEAEEGLTAAHACLLSAHVFEKTHPSPLVGRQLQDAFLAHAAEMLVPSSVGRRLEARPTREVSTVPEAFRPLVRLLPELPTPPPSARRLGCLAFYEQLERLQHIRPLDVCRLCEHFERTTFVCREERAGAAGPAAAPAAAAPAAGELTAADLGPLLGWCVGGRFDLMARRG